MADCSDAMDSKNQGIGQEFVDISKALNKDQNKRNELSEMKGGSHKIQSRESVQNHKDVETGTKKMSDCNQGCDKMAHKEPGSDNLIDINKCVTKEQPKQEDGIHKQRIDVEAIFKNDSSGTGKLKKTECQ